MDRFGFGTDYVIPEPDMPDMRPYWHQLVVLGNGFDLECKLHSDFPAFINARSETFLARNEGRQSPAAYESFRYTLWDEILKSGSESMWCDVEGSIGKWLLPPRKGTFSKMEELHTDIIHVASNPDDDIPDDIARVRNYITSSASLASSEPTENEFYEYVFEELHAFENDFRTYLTNAVNEDAGYVRRAKKFFCELFKDELVSDEDYETNCS